MPPEYRAESAHTNSGSRHLPRRSHFAALICAVLFGGAILALLAASLAPFALAKGDAAGGVESKPLPGRERGKPAPFPHMSDYAPPVSPHREGGPDAFGYVFADNRDPGGPVYSFLQAPTRIGDTDWQKTYTNNFDEFDDGVITDTLPFVFNFYGSNYTTIHIATNGNVHFGAPNERVPPSSDPCLPSANASVPRGMVAPHWFDFVAPLVTSSTNGTDGVYKGLVGTAPNRAYVVEWRNVHEFDEPNNRATFEVLLYESGEIIFQYQSLSSSSVSGEGGVVGIQNVNATIGLPYSCYIASLVQERAIRYRVRAAVLFTTGAVSGGGAPGSTVTYNGTVINQTGIENSFTISPTGNVWATSVEPANTGTLARGASRTVEVRVQIPVGAPIGSRDVVTINVRSDLSNPAVYTATAALTTTVSNNGVEFAPAALSKSGGYGAPVTHTVRLTNRSGQSNSFILSGTGSNWETRIEPEETGTLQANASTPITITVFVPVNSTLGESDSLQLTAEGQLPEPGVYFGAVPITTTAGAWERKSFMPQPRSRGSAVAFPANGKVYAIGGENNNGNTDLPIEEYDPLNDTWTARATLPVGVSNVDVEVIGNAIYIAGGYNGATASVMSTLQVYYPLENRVAVIATDPLPEARYGAGVAASGGKLYVIGGSPAGTGTNTVFEYNPAAPAGGRWRTRAPMPTARLYLGVGAVDGILYAVGGAPGQPTDLATLESYNPMTDQWRTDLSPMMRARSGLAVVGVNTGEAGCGGYLYALAGGSNSPYTVSAERYSPAANRWEPVSNLTLARRNLAATYSPNAHALLAMGGWTGQYESVNERVFCSGSFVLPSPTATPLPPCGFFYSDVPPNNTFYTQVMCLACRGIVSGYADGSFRPNAEITRGQLAKVVANAAGLLGTPTSQTYEDVPLSSTFYEWIERLTEARFIGGYPCGGPGEPCGTGNKPYFRPAAPATRGQISKIVSEAARFSEPPGVQRFEDVPPTQTFYVFIGRLASRGYMGGYPCGMPGEPCGAGNRPYFRPQNNATRGQISKIVSNTFFPECQPPPTPTPATATPTNTAGPPTVTRTPTSTRTPRPATATRTATASPTLTPLTPLPTSTVGTPSATGTPQAGCTPIMSADVPKTITDGGTITSTLTVGAAGTVADVDVVGLNVTHTYIGDLRVSLTSPGGASVVLINRVCNTARAQNFTNISLDDSAGQAIGSVCPPAAGSAYTPTNPLAAFNGTSAAGVWTLTISDLATQDTGALNAWGLRVTGSTGCGAAPVRGGGDK